MQLKKDLFLIIFIKHLKEYPSVFGGNLIGRYPWISSLLEKRSDFTPLLAYRCKVHSILEK
jgi:hypothetical protein